VYRSDRGVREGDHDTTEVRCRSRRGPRRDVERGSRDFAVAPPD
jgi:hypothetical protein